MRRIGASHGFWAASFSPSLWVRCLLLSTGGREGTEPARCRNRPSMRDRICRENRFMKNILLGGVCLCYRGTARQETGRRFPEG